MIRLKKKHKFVFSFLTLLIIILSISPFAYTYISTGILLGRFSQQLFDYKVPENTVIVGESYRKHTDPYKFQFRAILLINTNMSLEDVKKYYDLSKFNPYNIKRKDFYLEILQADDKMVYDLILSQDNFAYKKHNITPQYSSNYAILLYDSRDTSAFDLIEH